MFLFDALYFLCAFLRFISARSTPEEELVISKEKEMRKMNENKGLKKNLGVATAMATVVGCVIGSGVVF